VKASRKAREGSKKRSDTSAGQQAAGSPATSRFASNQQVRQQPAGSPATGPKKRTQAVATIWDARAGKLQFTLPHRVLIHQVAFSADELRLASACGNPNEIFGSVGEVRLWDMRSGGEVMTLGQQTGLVQRVTFSADGHRLASESQGEVKIWGATPLGEE
jgi:WD40 repeat protein